MDSVEALKRAIIAQVKAQTPVQTLWAECQSTNAEEGTMVAVVDGLEYDDVLLGLGADITVPEPGSKVLLGVVENQREATFLLFAERIAMRKLNGDVFGGLVKADVVAQELAALQADVNQLKQAFLAWVPIAGPTTDGAAGLKTLAAAWAGQPMMTTQSVSLQNAIVSHG